MKPIHYTIYQIQHKKSGKIYIGKHQTEDLTDDYFGSGKHLKRAVDKHGRDAFTKTILHTFTTEQEMNKKEKELVTEEFCRRKDTYNICEGGKGGFGYLNSSGQNNNGGLRGVATNDAFRKMGKRRQLELLLDPDWSKTHGKRISVGLLEYFRHHDPIFLGRRHTTETKQKMSEAHKGKAVGTNNGRFGTMWITDGINSKTIPATDTIPDGWYKGRRMKT